MGGTMAKGIGQPLIHCQLGDNYHPGGQVVVIGGFWGIGNVGNISGFQLVVSTIGACKFKLPVRIIGIIRFIIIGVIALSIEVNHKNKTTIDYVKLILTTIN
jgi:hypothetical protein